MSVRNSYDALQMDEPTDVMSCSQRLISSDIATRSNCVCETRSGFCCTNHALFRDLVTSQTCHARNSRVFGAFVFETNELIDHGRPSPAQHTEPPTEIERSWTRIDGYQRDDHFTKHAAHVDSPFHAAKVETSGMD